MSTKSRKRKALMRRFGFDKKGVDNFLKWKDFQKKIRMVWKYGVTPVLLTEVQMDGFRLLDRQSEEAKNHKEYHNWNNNENKEQIKWGTKLETKLQGKF